MFLLRSYRRFARVPHESRKVPAREAASDPNERLVTECLAPVKCRHLIDAHKTEPPRRDLNLLNPLKSDVKQRP